MVTELRTFKGNAIAIELTQPFTTADSTLIAQLFDEKLNEGYKHVNILIKVKDMSLVNHMEFKAFWESEIWGIKRFSKIARCAVVAHSDTIKFLVKLEAQALHIVNPAFDEKYFDTAQLDEALVFISEVE